MNLSSLRMYEQSILSISVSITHVSVKNQHLTIFNFNVLKTTHFIYVFVWNTITIQEFEIVMMK